MRSEPKFYLKNNKADKATPIILNLKVHGKTFRYSIQKSISPELWDKSTQKPSKDKKVIERYKKRILNQKKNTTAIQHTHTLKTDLKNIENRIYNLDRDVRKFFNILEQDNKPLHFDKLKAYLDNLYKKVESTIINTKQKELNDFVNDFIIGIENGTILIDSGVNYGKKYKSSSIKTWKEWKTLLNDYQKDNGVLKWDTIDMIIYEDILNHYYSKLHSINTVGKFIKNLKSILRRGYEKKLHNNTIHNNKNFRVLKEEVDIITLNFEELEKLYIVDLSNNKSLDFYRDIFLIGCYTALRVSDVRKLKKSHIVKNSDKLFIKLWTEKGDGSSVTIPVSSKLNKILEKYNYKIPKINHQKYGLAIKEVCKMIGMISKVETKSSKGGKVERKAEQRYKLVTSHTARRTGATLMYLSGISSLLIMKITGHKKESTFMKYINITKEQSAKLMASNPYFV